MNVADNFSEVEETIVTAVEGITEVGAQLGAMLSLYEKKLADELRKLSEIVKTKLELQEVNNVGPEPETELLWVYRRWMYQYKIPVGRTDSRRAVHIALDVVLWDEEVQQVTGRRPVILVCGNTDRDDPLWEESVTEDFFKLDSKYLRERSWQLRGDGRVWWWQVAEKCYWVFIVPLLAIKDERAVLSELVDPIIKLTELSRFSDASAEDEVKAALKSSKSIGRFREDGDDLRMEFSPLSQP